jgi:protein-S-isoprenylcysteine O-methyltransferase Ste14
MARHGRAIAGGVWVLVVTAWAAFLELVQPHATLAYRIASIVLVLLLLVGAWLLARFIRRHGDEIGEAWFDTRNKDDRDG